jgi:predicted MPP superfamily phosphohydrolase
MRAGWLIAFVALYVVATLLHWAAWRWFARIAPRWCARYRRPALGAFVVLYLLPLARAAIFFHPRDAVWPMVAAVGMLWHLTIAMSMAVIGLFRGGRAIYERAERRILRARGAGARSTGAAVAENADASVGVNADANVAGDEPGARGVGADVEGSAGPAKRGAGAFDAKLDRRQALERAAGAVAFAASSGALAWGTLRGRYEWSIEEIVIPLAKLPKALDGFTIVQLSDLHVGTFIEDRELDRGLGLLDRIRADLVVITGDIVDADPHYVPIAARRLGALKARHGVACIPGNHDYFTGEAAVLGGMRSAGIDVLVNRGKIIAPGDGGGFALLGVDDLSARSDTHRTWGPDLTLEKSMVPSDRATVLLAHQPRFAPFAARHGIDLQLSGHTHGGQINLGIRPVDFLYQYVEGRYQVGDMQLYVNRGFGTVGPPTRVGAPPEITKIVLVAG